MSQLRPDAKKGVASHALPSKVSRAICVYILLKNPRGLAEDLFPTCTKSLLSCWRTQNLEAYSHEGLLISGSLRGLDAKRGFGSLTTFAPV